MKKRTIEEEYWNFSRDYNFFHYLNPVNIEDCRVKFFEAIEEKRIVNPIFEYRRIDFDIKSTIKKFNVFRENFIKLTDFESKMYVRLIDNEISWIKNISTRTNADFKLWLSSLYGTPKRQYFLDATDDIGKLKKRKYPSKHLCANEVKLKIEKELRDREYHHWNIELTDIAAKISINSPNYKFQ